MEIPTDRKMTFIEYLAFEESDGDSIDEMWFKHWDKTLPNILRLENTKEHIGDCTKISSTCILCWLELMLKEYKDYFFDKKQTDNKMNKEETKEIAKQITYRILEIFTAIAIILLISFIIFVNGWNWGTMYC